MKKAILYTLMLFGVVLLSIASSLGTYYAADKFIQPSQEDTAFVHQIALQSIDEVLYPTFHNMNEMWEFHDKMAQDYMSDSIFAGMPVDVLTNITMVVLGRQGYATQADIVMEYRQHYGDIYQYLGDPNNQPTSDNSGPSSQQQQTTSDDNHRQSPTVGRAAGDTDTVIEGTSRPVNDEDSHE